MSSKSMILALAGRLHPSVHVALAIDRISPARQLDRRAPPGAEVEKIPAPPVGMESRRKPPEVEVAGRPENNAVHHLLEIGFLFILLV
jgi:hypothetical protein